MPELKTSHLFGVLFILILTVALAVFVGKDFYIHFLGGASTPSLAAAPVTIRSYIRMKPVCDANTSKERSDFVLKCVSSKRAISPDECLQLSRNLYCPEKPFRFYERYTGFLGGWFLYKVEQLK